MIRLTGFVAASLCTLALTGSSLWAGGSQLRVTADWQDGFAPGYSNYGPGGVPSGRGSYEQWTPNSNTQYGPDFSAYGGPANGGEFQNSPSPFAPGQGPRRHGCHHGRCYSSPFNNYGGSPTTAPNFGDPNWGAAPYYDYGPANGAPYGSGVSQPFGQGSSPSQPQFFGQGRSLAPQSPVSSFGPSTNFPPPPFPNRGLRGQGQNYPNQNQNYSDPYSSSNQPLNSYNQQPNSFGPSSNSFGAPPQSFSQPSYNQPSYNQPSYNQPGYNQPSYNQPNGGYGQPGPSFGQPRSNYGQRAPMFSQPQSSPFYP